MWGLEAGMASTAQKSANPNLLEDFLVLRHAEHQLKTSTEHVGSTGIRLASRLPTVRLNRGRPPPPFHPTAQLTFFTRQRKEQRMRTEVVIRLSEVQATLSFSFLLSPSLSLLDGEVWSTRRNKQRWIITISGLVRPLVFPQFRG